MVGYVNMSNVKFDASQMTAIQYMIEKALNDSTRLSAIETGIKGNKDGISGNAASMDHAWLVLGGALVFFMHSGFSLLEVGSVSASNVQNILFKNMVSPTFAAILFWFCGYTIAFGGNGKDGFMGTRDGWFLNTDNMFEPSGAGMPYNSGEYCSWFFQWAFAATASTIVSGAVAERINFQVYMVLTVALTAFIYPVVVHWQWGGGWAGTWGVLDFAGSGVVHMVGGVAALVSALYVGPRHGRFVTHFEHDGDVYVKSEELRLPADKRHGWCKITFGSTWQGAGESTTGQTWNMVTDEDTNATLDNMHTTWVDNKRVHTAKSGTVRYSNLLPANSPAFQTLGCLILWFGWYGFNCGSTLGISGDFGGQAGKVAVTTTLGAAAGSISSGLVTRYFDGLLDLSSLSNGVLAGLVGITAPCALIEPWAAIVIGAVAGIVLYAVTALLEKFEIDDVVLAIPVHLGCGLWGLIATGLFTSPLNADAAFSVKTCGVFYGCAEGGKQLWMQLVFAAAIIGWVGGTVALLLQVMKAFGVPMAYDVNTQVEGMDKKHDRASSVTASPTKATRP